MDNDVTRTFSYRLRRKLASYVFNPRNFRYHDAPSLQDIHLKHARLLEARTRILDLLPKQGIIAEVGVQKGNFSAEILARMNPRKLHLIDFEDGSVQLLRSRYALQIESGLVDVHHGDSAECLRRFPDHHFDMIYLDANHSYPFIHNELEISRTKIKPDGHIVCNDYIFYDHAAGRKYGVVEAVNEFCITYQWEVLFFALSPQLFNDVCLRKIPA